jgi:hypothetical protein
MHPLVREYRSLPPSSDHLPDDGPNGRKTAILRELDEDANDPDVSQLLLDILRDPAEFDLARVEAVQVAGLYIDESSPLAQELKAELERIVRDEEEDEMVRGWAERYVEAASDWPAGQHGAGRQGLPG